MFAAYAIFFLIICLPFLKYNRDFTPMTRMTEVILETPPEFLLPKLSPATPRAESFKEEVIKKKPEQATQVKVVKEMEELPVVREQSKITETEKTDSVNQHSMAESEHTGGQTSGDYAFDFADVMPSYPGGNHALSWFIHSKLIYPKEAVAQKTEGIVVVGFVVDQYGRVRQPKILKSLTPVCDAEALRVVRLIPDWMPGQNKGRNVSVLFKLPIEFKLAR